MHHGFGGTGVARERATTSGGSPQRPSSRRAITRPASQPGARPPGGGPRRSVSTPAHARSHETGELEFQMSPVPSSSRPQTAIGTDGTRLRTRCARVRSFATRRARDRLARVGDGASAPSTYLVAEEPATSGPSGPDRALGDHAALSSPLVADRRGLDDEAAVGDLYLKRGVVQGEPRAVLDRCLDRLVCLSIQTHQVATRAQGDPIEVDCSGGGR
jgi:hypothetical protein